MTDKKGEAFGIVSYILGILSIVFAFVTPLAGIIVGIIGIIQSKKHKSEFSVKGKKLSTIGLVLSVIVMIVTAIMINYITKNIRTIPLA